MPSFFEKKAGILKLEAGSEMIHGNLRLILNDMQIWNKPSIWDVHFFCKKASMFLIFFPGGGGGGKVFLNVESWGEFSWYPTTKPGQHGNGSLFNTFERQKPSHQRNPWAARNLSSTVRYKTCLDFFGQNNDLCWGLNSHCFPMVGMVINLMVGLYMPIPGLPFKGGMTIPNTHRIHVWFIHRLGFHHH